MSNNYNINYINQVNYHNRTKNYQKKKNIFPNKGNIREVEINSITQTEPTKQKENYNKKIDNDLNQIDQFDYISKTNRRVTIEYILLKDIINKSSYLNTKLVKLNFYIIKLIKRKVFSTTFIYFRPILNLQPINFHY